MSVIMPADHHATFAGWDAGKTREDEPLPAWSSRRRAGILILCAVASWLLVLSPFLILG